MLSNAVAARAWQSANVSIGLSSRALTMPAKRNNNGASDAMVGKKAKTTAPTAVVPAVAAAQAADNGKNSEAVTTAASGADAAASGADAAASGAGAAVAAASGAGAAASGADAKQKHAVLMISASQHFRPKIPSMEEIVSGRAPAVRSYAIKLVNYVA